MIESARASGDTRLQLFMTDAHSLTILGYYNSVSRIMWGMTLGYLCVGYSGKPERKGVGDLFKGATAVSLLMSLMVSAAKRKVLHSFIVRIEFCCLTEKFVVVYPSAKFMDFGEIKELHVHPAAFK